MSVRFDASTDRLLRTSDLLDIDANYTWMAWIYLESTGTQQTVMSHNPNGASNEDTFFVSSSGQLFTRVHDGTAGTNTGGSTISSGTWYHIALVRDAVNAFKLYLNASLDFTNPRDVSGRTTPPTRMEIGARRTANADPFDGRAFAVKSWATDLSAAEVANEWRTIRPQHKLSDLYGWWPCLPGATERLRDYSGRGRDFTEVGTLTDEEAERVRWGGNPFLIQVAAAAPATGNPWYAYAQQ